MRVVSVVGARPQFVKASVTCRAIADRGIEQALIHTGQHYDREMSQIFFDELAIPLPASDLGVGSGSHAHQTAAMMERLEPTLGAERPDLVLTYGDTNSTLAAALVAVKMGLSVAHVEAGLRSFNRRMPEEINRVVTDHVSDLLFAPTQAAVANLRAEGLPVAAVHHVGDVMYDAALAFEPIAARTSRVLDGLTTSESEGFVLATLHRVHNTDDPARLACIIQGLAQVASSFPVLFPVHPRTAAAIRRHSIDARDLNMMEPVGYLDMQQLERHALVIVTDSGGVQKESFFHRVPCVTVREETEWPESVELGWNRLCPPSSPEAIAEAVIGAVGSDGDEGEPYGSGTASVAIAEVLLRCGS